MRRTLWTTALLALASITAVAQMDAQAGAQPRGTRQGRFSPPVQGTVTAVAADHVTVRTDAGDSFVILVGENTRLVRSREPIKLDDIKAGDSVTAFGQVDEAKKTVQAMALSDIPAEAVAKAKENLGKTYIIGHITAIDADNLKITVMRSDNVSQTIAVDDGTSFQRGMRGVAQDIVAAGGLPGAMGGFGFGGGRGMRGQMGAAQQAPPPPESITLADIKVGDAVEATGTVKGDAFTAVKMGVSEPGASRRGNPGGPEGAQGPPPPPQQ